MGLLFEFQICWPWHGTSVSSPVGIQHLELWDTPPVTWIDSINSPGILKLGKRSENVWQFLKIRTPNQIHTPKEKLKAVSSLAFRVFRACGHVKTDPWNPPSLFTRLWLGFLLGVKSTGLTSQWLAVSNINDFFCINNGTVRLLLSIFDHWWGYCSLISHNYPLSLNHFQDSAPDYPLNNTPQKSFTVCEWSIFA